MSIAIGTQLGSYEITALLGKGGFGEVYRAKDRKLKREVAIKLLPDEFSSNLDRLTRFQREAEILASLNHPNIAAIYDLAAQDQSQFLVLELVDGETPHGPLPVADALRIAYQISDALAAAHQKGIIHRDLKPPNIKVTSDGRVKVLDFGLAKAILGPSADRDLSQLTTAVNDATVAGHIVGTPGYMSPEQARGQEVDQRTDIWAFGCLLYELLVGKRAFERPTISETIAAVLEGEPDWKALPSNTPSRIRTLLRQCLHKDVARRLDSIADVRNSLEPTQYVPSRRAMVVAGLLLAILTAGVVVWLRGPARSTDSSHWIRLTNFPDSVSQPALSSDGRMLAFIRGSGTFIGPGQVYVKMLPDGDPIQLTNDRFPKMHPVFSPDGTHIAYTVQTPQFRWDTWLVAATGGAPQEWLSNASGLSWSDPHRLLFSEIKVPGPHMGIVVAGENRTEPHDVYLPENQRGMAHRSYASPDGKWVLLVEMDKDGLWAPCRVVPMDGQSSGRSIGPPGADCTFGAWSHDGKFVYVTSNFGGRHHIWRQAFPDGQPEQITSSLTEEEGVAMAPDGRSFITAVALQSGSIWVHDAHGERQISLEGTGADPIFTPDGKKILYRVLPSVPMGGSLRNPGEVWVADLDSGRSEPFVRGLQALSFDVSADGRQVVMEVIDREGKPRLLLTPLDRSTGPKQIPNVEGRECFFGPEGEIFFRRSEANSGFVYRVRTDGTGLRKAIEQPIAILFGVSSDGWLIGWAELPNKGTTGTEAFSLNSGTRIPLGGSGLDPLRYGNIVSIFGSPIVSGRSYLIPSALGEILTKLPPGGFHSEDEIAHLPGAIRVDAGGITPGPTLDLYAFYRGSVQRNLYRIPVP